MNKAFEYYVRFKRRRVSTDEMFERTARKFDITVKQVKADIVAALYHYLDLGGKDRAAYELGVESQSSVYRLSEKLGMNLAKYSERRKIKMPPKEVIIKALEDNNGINRTSKALDVTRHTLYQWLNKYDIHPEDYYASRTRKARAKEQYKSQFKKKPIITKAKMLGGFHI